MLLEHYFYQRDFCIKIDSYKLQSTKKKNTQKEGYINGWINKWID